MSKQNKFNEILYIEIIKGITMEGREPNTELIQVQAQVIADELVKQFDGMTAQDLVMLIPLARKNEGKITFNTIAKTFVAPEWHIKLSEYKNEQKKAIAITNQGSSKIPSELWRAIFWYEVSKLCSRYKAHEWGSREEYERFILGANIELHIDKLEAEAIREGRTPDQYSVDISMNKVGQ